MRVAGLGGAPNCVLVVDRVGLRPLSTFHTHCAQHGVARTPCKLSTMHPHVHAWSWGRPVSSPLLGSQLGCVSCQGAVLLLESRDSSAASH